MLNLLIFVKFFVIYLEDIINTFYLCNIITLLASHIQMLYNSTNLIANMLTQEQFF